jgi:hypothetical protein
MGSFPHGLYVCGSYVCNQNILHKKLSFMGDDITCFLALHTHYAHLHEQTDIKRNIIAGKLFTSEFIKREGIKLFCN